MKEKRWTPFGLDWLLLEFGHGVIGLLARLSVADLRRWEREPTRATFLQYEVLTPSTINAVPTAPEIRICVNIGVHSGALTRFNC